LNSLLTVTNLFYRHNKDEEWFLKNINFQIKAGEKILIRGRSGSGKTTLAQLVAGLKSPVRGSVARQGKISLVSRDFSLYGELTVGENLEFFAKLNEAGGNFRQLVCLTGLDRWRDVPAGRVPESPRKMLQLAVALNRDFSVLLLDEPTLGVDAEGKKKLDLILNEVATRGAGLAVFSGDWREAAGYSKVYFLEEGSLVESFQEGTAGAAAGVIEQ